MTCSLVLNASEITCKQKVAHFVFFVLNLFKSSGKIVLLGPYSLRSMHVIILSVMSRKFDFVVLTFSSR